MDSGSYYEDNNSNIVYVDVKLIEYIEVLFLKFFVGYNVMIFV